MNTKRNQSGSTISKLSETKDSCATLKIAIEKFQGAYNKAAASIEGRKAMGADAEADVGRQTRISNDLVMAGSNAAMRMQILGPTLQSESKKQTALLERIATNTEKTADNTEESAKEGFDTLDK